MNFVLAPYGHEKYKVDFRHLTIIKPKIYNDSDKIINLFEKNKSSSDLTSLKINNSFNSLHSLELNDSSSFKNSDSYNLFPNLDNNNISITHMDDDYMKLYNKLHDLYGYILITGEIKGISILSSINKYHPENTCVIYINENPDYVLKKMSTYKNCFLCYGMTKTNFMTNNKITFISNLEDLICVLHDKILENHDVVFHISFDVSLLNNSNYLHTELVQIYRFVKHRLIALDILKCDTNNNKINEEKMVYILSNILSK